MYFLFMVRGFILLLFFLIIVVELFNQNLTFIMKQSFLFLVVLVMFSFVSCQKKQYASFQKSPQPQYEHATKKLAVGNAPVVETTEAKEAVISLPANPTETFSADNSAAIAIDNNVVTETKTVVPLALLTKKLSLKEKIQAVKQIKSLSKQLKKSSVAHPKADSADTLAVLSLILGAAGLVLLFVAGWVGLLLGLVGLIMGVISLQRTNKRGMAVAGIILGALSLLIGLIVVIFIASLFTSFAR